MDIHNKTLAPWIILGDESKYVFAKWCGNIVDGITTKQLRSKEVYIYFDTVPHIEIGKESISIYSDILLRGSCAHIPTGNDSYIPSHTQVATVLVFESFPFGKDNIKQLTENWKRCNHSVLNVLMDLPIRHGSTDLQQGEDSCKEIEEEYIKNKFTVLRINETSDISEVFYWHEDIITHWKLKAKNELQAFKNIIIDYAFDYFDWTVDVTDNERILSTQRLYELSSLKAFCKLGKKNISIKDAYCESIEQFIFKSKDFESLLYSFSQICQCVVLPMDSEKLCIKAKKELKKAFFFELDNLFLNNTDICVPILTEELFEEIITDESGSLYGINERVNELISNFFGILEHESSKVFQYLVGFMEAYLKKMEDLLA